MIRPLPARQAVAATALASLFGALLLWTQGGAPGAGRVPIPEPPLPAAAASPRPAAPAKPAPAGRLDINRAGVAELQQLPGIGRSLARRIVAHREAGGPFASPEELLRVPGIGPKRLDRLRPWVAVGGSS